MNRIIELLRYATDSSRAFGEVALVNVFGFVLLLIVFMFYWNFPQAKDLLLTLNQDNNWQVFFFFITLINLALLCWYLPRFLYKENNVHIHTFWDLFKNMDEHRQANSSEVVATEASYWKKAMPRLVGFLILIIAISGILNVASEVDTTFLGGFNAYWLLLLIVIIYLVMRTWRPILGVILPGSLGRLFDVYQSFPEFRFIPFYQAYKDYSRILQKEGGLAEFIKVRYTYMMSPKKMTSDQSMKFELFNTFYKQRFEKTEESLRRITTYGVLGAGAVFFVLMLLRNQNRQDLHSLGYLFFSGIILAILFLIFTIRRKGLRFFGDHVIAYTVAILTIILSISFLLISFNPSWSRGINPLTCANMAFIFHLTILYVLRIIGAREDIYVVALIVVILGVFSTWNVGNRHHEVAYVEDTISTAARLDVESYFEEWLKKRTPFIEAYLESEGRDSTFPVVILSAEGGGSRAGYWTAITHAYLQQKAPNYFDKYLFALTGASGGNTGNSVFYSMQTGGVPAAQLQPHAAKIFEQNFLSSSLTLLLGLDSWQTTFGLDFRPDRARELVKEWSGALQDVAKVNLLEAPFLSFWYENNQLKPNVPPLLLINTTHVQAGDHAIFSPVIFDEKYYNGMDLLDSIEVHQEGKSVSLGTANLLNASFPYINSAGNVKNVGSFVDAGYYDNFGALTAIGLIERLKDIREKAPDSSLIKKLSFVSVLVQNSTVESPPKLATTTAQLTAPVNSIANIRTAVNKHNKWNLNLVGDKYFEVNLSAVELLLENGSEPIRPVVPLARYLSPLAIEAMTVSQQEQIAENKTDLVELVKLLQETAKTDTLQGQQQEQ